MAAQSRTAALSLRSGALTRALHHSRSILTSSASLIRAPRLSDVILHASDALAGVPYHSSAVLRPSDALTRSSHQPFTILRPSDALAHILHQSIAILHPSDARTPVQSAAVFRPSDPLNDILHRSIAIHHYWSSIQHRFHPTLSSLYSRMPRAHIMFIVITGVSSASYLLGLDLDRSDGHHNIVPSIVYSETKQDDEEIAEGEQMLEEMTKQEKEKAEMAKIKAIIAEEIKKWEDKRNSKGQDGRDSSNNKEGGCLFARFLQRLENIFGIPGRLMRLKTTIEEGYVLAIAVYMYLPTILVLNHTEIITKLREKHQEMADKAAALVWGDIVGQPSPPSSSTGKMPASPSSSGVAVQPSHCSSSTGHPSNYPLPSDVAGQQLSPSSSSTRQLSTSPSPGATENVEDMGEKNDEDGD